MNTEQGKSPSGFMVNTSCHDGILPTILAIPLNYEGNNSNATSNVPAS